VLSGLRQPKKIEIDYTRLHSDVEIQCFTAIVSGCVYTVECFPNPCG